MSGVVLAVIAGIIYVLAVLFQTHPLLALALLVLLRTDLIASWRQATPVNAPDRFVINVQPEQAQDFLAHLKTAGVQSPDWFPMIRGRLVAINGRVIGPDDLIADLDQALAKAGL